MINGISKITGTVKNNAVAFSTCVILIAGVTTSTNAQTTVVLTKHDAVEKMATSQYWDVNNENKSSKKHTAQQSATINSPGNYNISGEDKYLKTMEAGKRYSEFQ